MAIGAAQAGTAGQPTFGNAAVLVAGGRRLLGAQELGRVAGLLWRMKYTGRLSLIS
jgi:hypothetical protein